MKPGSQHLKGRRSAAALHSKALGALLNGRHSPDILQRNSADTRVPSRLISQSSSSLNMKSLINRAAQRVSHQPEATSKLKLAPNGSEMLFEKANLQHLAAFISRKKTGEVRSRQLKAQGDQNQHLLSSENILKHALISVGRTKLAKKSPKRKSRSRSGSKGRKKNQANKIPFENLIPTAKEEAYNDNLQFYEQNRPRGLSSSGGADSSCEIINEARLSRSSSGGRCLTAQLSKAKRKGISTKITDLRSEGQDILVKHVKDIKKLSDFYGVQAPLDLSSGASTAQAKERYSEKAALIPKPSSAKKKIRIVHRGSRSSSKEKLTITSSGMLSKLKNIGNDPVALAQSCQLTPLHTQGSSSSKKRMRPARPASRNQAQSFHLTSKTATSQSEAMKIHTDQTGATASDLFYPPASSGNITRQYLTTAGSEMRTGPTQANFKIPVLEARPKPEPAQTTAYNDNWLAFQKLMGQISPKLAKKKKRSLVSMSRTYADYSPKAASTKKKLTSTRSVSALSPKTAKLHKKLLKQIKKKPSRRSLEQKNPSMFGNMPCMTGQFYQNCILGWNIDKPAGCSACRHALEDTPAMNFDNKLVSKQNKQLLNLKRKSRQQQNSSSPKQQSSAPRRTAEKIEPVEPVNMFNDANRSQLQSTPSKKGHQTVSLRESPQSSSSSQLAKKKAKQVVISKIRTQVKMDDKHPLAEETRGAIKKSMTQQQEKKARCEDRGTKGNFSPLENNSSSNHLQSSNLRVDGQIDNLIVPKTKKQKRSASHGSHGSNPSSKNSSGSPRKMKFEDTVIIAQVTNKLKKLRKPQVISLGPLDKKRDAPVQERVDVGDTSGTRRDADPSKGAAHGTSTDEITSSVLSKLEEKSTHRDPTSKRRSNPAAPERSHFQRIRPKGSSDGTENILNSEVPIQPHIQEFFRLQSQLVEGGGPLPDTQQIPQQLPTKPLTLAKTSSMPSQTETTKPSYFFRQRTYAQDESGHLMVTAPGPLVGTQQEPSSQGEQTVVRLNSGVIHQQSGSNHISSQFETRKSTEQKVVAHQFSMQSYNPEQIYSGFRRVSTKQELAQRQLDAELIDAPEAMIETGHFNQATGPTQDLNEVQHPSQDSNSGLNRRSTNSKPIGESYDDSQGNITIRMNSSSLTSQVEVRKSQSSASKNRLSSKQSRASSTVSKGSSGSRKGKISLKLTAGQTSKLATAVKQMKQRKGPPVPEIKSSLQQSDYRSIPQKKGDSSSKGSLSGGSLNFHSANPKGAEQYNSRILQQQKEHQWPVVPSSEREESQSLISHADGPLMRHQLTQDDRFLVPLSTQFASGGYLKKANTSLFQSNSEDQLNPSESAKTINPFQTQITSKFDFQRKSQTKTQHLPLCREATKGEESANESQWWDTTSSHDHQLPSSSLDLSSAAKPLLKVIQEDQSDELISLINEASRLPKLDFATSEVSSARSSVLSRFDEVYVSLEEPDKTEKDTWNTKNLALDSSMKKDLRYQLCQFVFAKTRQFIYNSPWEKIFFQLVLKKEEQNLRREETFTSNQSKRLQKCLKDVFDTLMLGKFRKIRLRDKLLFNQHHKILLHSYDIHFKGDGQSSSQSTMRHKPILEELQALAGIKPKQTPDTSPLPPLTLSFQEEAFEESNPIWPQITYLGLVDLRQEDFNLESKLRTRSKMKSLKNYLLSVAEQKDKYEREMEAYRKHASYIDMVWQNKNNKEAFILVTRPHELDQVIEVITLFDAKTKTGLDGVYDELDWKIVEAHKTAFQLKMLNILSLHSENFQASVSSIVRKNFNIIDSKYKIQKCSLQQLLQQIPLLVRESLYDGLTRRNVVMPLVLKFKIGLCTERLMVLINRFKFSKRFTGLVALKEFTESWFSKVDKTRLGRNLCGVTTFRDHYAYQLVVHNKVFSYYQLLFQSEPTSVKRKLFYPELDFQLNGQQQRLLMIAKELHRKKLFMDKTRFNVFDPFVFNREVRERSNSITLSQSALRKHRLISAFFFDRDKQKQKPFLNSDSEDPTPLPFHRQGAVDRYNHGFCQFQVTQEFEKRIERVKDSQNMFYKQIETLLDDDDSDYNDLSHVFGFKSCVIRDLRRPNFVFEAYFPIICKKGEKKLQNLERKQFAEDKLGKKINSSCMRILKDIQPDEFDTDNSMKSIGIEDIKSDQSDFNDARSRTSGNSPKQPKGLRHILMGGAPTPIEIYSHIKAAKAQSDAKTNKSSSSVSAFSSFLQQKKPKDDMSMSSDNSREKDAQMFLNSMLRAKPRVKSRVYQVKGVDNLVEDGDEKSMPSKAMNRFKVEKMVNHSKKAVLKDNVQEIEALLQEVAYIDRLMEGYTKSHQITLDQLQQIPVGKVLFKRKADLEDAARKVQKKIQANSTDSHRLFYQEYFSPGRSKPGKEPAPSKTKMKDRVKRCLAKKKENELKIVDPGKKFPQPKNNQAAEQPGTKQPGALVVEVPKEEESDSDHTYSLRKTKSSGSRYILKQMQDEIKQTMGRVKAGASEKQQVSSRSSSSDSRSSLSRSISLSASQSLSRSASFSASGASRLSPLKPLKRVHNPDDSNSFSSQSIGSTPREQKAQFEKMKLEKSVTKWTMNTRKYIDMIMNEGDNEPTGLEGKLYKLIKEENAQKRKAAIQSWLENKGDENSDLEIDNELQILGDLQQKKQLQREERERKMRKRLRLFQQLKPHRHDHQKSEAGRPVLQSEQRKMEKQITEAILSHLENLKQRGRDSEQGDYPWSKFRPMNFALDHHLSQVTSPSPSARSRSVDLPSVSPGGTVSSHFRHQLLLEANFNSNLESTRRFGLNKSPPLSGLRTGANLEDAQNNEFKIKKEHGLLLETLNQKMLQAVRNSNIGRVDDILKRFQGKSDVKDEHGNSLVAIAAMNGDIKMVKLLLSRGLSASGQNEDGNTALHFAVAGKFMRIVDALVNLGVDEEVENYDGVTPWEMVDL